MRGHCQDGNMITHGTPRASVLIFMVICVLGTDLAGVILHSDDESDTTNHSHDTARDSTLNNVKRGQIWRRWTRLVPRYLIIDSVTTCISEDCLYDEGDWSPCDSTTKVKLY